MFSQYPCLCGAVIGLLVTAGALVSSEIARGFADLVQRGLICRIKFLNIVRQFQTSSGIPDINVR